MDRLLALRFDTTFNLLNLATADAAAATQALSDAADRIERKWMDGLREDQLSSYFSFRAAGVPVFEAMRIIDKRGAAQP